MPLAILRPISGSTTMAIATDLITKFGADGEIGLIASTIMGATETTIFEIPHAALIENFKIFPNTTSINIKNIISNIFFFPFSTHSTAVSANIPGY